MKMIDLTIFTCTYIYIYVHLFIISNHTLINFKIHDFKY